MIRVIFPCARIKGLESPPEASKTTAQALEKHEKYGSSKANTDLNARWTNGSRSRVCIQGRSSRLSS